MKTCVMHWRWMVWTIDMLKLLLVKYHAVDVRLLLYINYCLLLLFFMICAVVYHYASKLIIKYAQH